MSRVRVLLWQLLLAFRYLQRVLNNAKQIAWIRVAIHKAALIARLVLSSGFRLELKAHDDNDALTHTNHKDPSIDARSLEVVASETITPKQRKPYKTMQNGQTISLLDGTMTSLYPFAGGNIRNRSHISLAPNHNQESTMRYIRGTNNSRISLARSVRRPGSIDLHKSPTGSVVGFDTTSWMAAENGFDGNLDQQRYSSREYGSVREVQHGNEPRGVATRDDIHGVIQIDVTPPEAGPGVNHEDSDLSVPTSTYLPSRSESGPVGTCSVQDNQRQLVAMNSSRNGSRADVASVKSRRSVALCINAPCTDSNASPVCPTETRRYRMMTRILKEDTDIVMEPLMLDFSEPAMPPGWTKISHPEGVRYFYHSDKRVYTDSEIHDPVILRHLENDIAYLTDLSTAFAVPFPDTAEFVINVYESEGELRSEYYCIDHGSRTVFFLHVFRASWLDAWMELPGVKSKALLRIELEAQYWFFVQLFPTSLGLTVDMISELRDVVLHLIGDSMTSPYSTACYNLDDLLKILGITNGLNKNCNSNHISGSMCLLARHMYIFMHSRFLNAHGESYARLERDFSVYGDKLHPRTWFIKLLSPLFFSAPDVHLVSLQRMWVDALLHKSAWEKMIASMTLQWREFLLSATILLNADIAFLAINGISDVDDTGWARGSPAQIAAYVSTIANLGSILVTLLLLHHHRTKSRETAAEVHYLLQRKKHPSLGFEPLAIIYGLPYALLIWGLISLLASLAFLCFQHTDTPTRSVTGAAGGLLVLLCAWCVFSFWESSKGEPTAEHCRPLAYVPAPERNLDGCSNSIYSAKQENGDENINSKRKPFTWIRRVLWHSRSMQRSYDTEKTAAF
ncbi:hypothetical protein D9619_007988 [Psilocybe cf. subviscida]|uniref:WW domain-containing protein n=1 Tax=Psilocybe cf. subviscida TaxID=2480587 RepID=A0A8H5AU37_9AGAR|nr:hypothetical protein D9619_007988 [Psilocybe cf. subviscida]